MDSPWVNPWVIAWKAGELAGMLDKTIILATGIVTGLLCTLAARSIARRIPMTAAPNPLVPQHTAPVAYLGGIGVFLGIASVYAVIRLFAPALDLPTGLPHARIYIPALALLLVGTADDRFVFNPPVKLALQSVSVLPAVLLGLVIPVTGFPAADMILSGVLLLGIVNAFNFTDVCDGLAGGLCIVTFLFAGFLGGGILPFAAAGACAGFLVFNLPPASIYLGDGGSNALGFLAAAVLFETARACGTCPGLPIILMAVGVPLFELTFLVFVRIRKGIPFWKGSSDHFALRLQQAGLSKIRTDAAAWGVAAALCLGAFALTILPMILQVAVVLLAISLLLLAARLLLRHEVDKKKRRG